jgi:hypothetical protein
MCVSITYVACGVEERFWSQQIGKTLRELHQSS